MAYHSRGAPKAIFGYSAACQRHNFPPATYLGMDEDGNMRLSCGATSELLVGEVQPAGKQKMPAQDFINGYRLQVGRSILG